MRYQEPQFMEIHTPRCLENWIEHISNIPNEDITSGPCICLGYNTK